MGCEAPQARQAHKGPTPILRVSPALGLLLRRQGCRTEVTLLNFELGRGWGWGWRLGAGISFVTNNLIMENYNFLSWSIRGGHKTLYDVAKNSSCHHSPWKWVKDIFYGTLRAGLSLYFYVTKLQTLELFWEHCLLPFPGLSLTLALGQSSFCSSWSSSGNDRSWRFPTVCPCKWLSTASQS